MTVDSSYNTHRMPKLNPEDSVVVAGSYNRANLPYIRDAIGEVVMSGARLLAPVFSTVTDIDAPFIVFDTDNPQASPRALETAFMDTITRAGLLLIVNHNPQASGRVGLSAAAEMAWAAINGTPYTTTEAMRHNEPMSNSLYFSNDITENEAGALYRKAARNESDPSPLPPVDPDYSTLLRLHERLLSSLPDA